MKIIAVNGSPRKHWNTAKLLEKTLEGAASAGMATELVHLYDLNFKGCTSCFACKLTGGKSHGRCAMRDDITPVLDAIHAADALVLGSPVYFFDATGEMRSFMERLCFHSMVYSNPPSSIFPKKIKTALLYTMNVNDETLHAVGMDKVFDAPRGFMERVFGSCELFFSTDTLQFADYTKYETSYFDAEAKNRRHETHFPKDLARAHDLGVRLAQK